MTALRPDFQAGSCRVNGATGAIVGAQSGWVQNSVRTGVGVYEITVRNADPLQHTADAQAIFAGVGKRTAVIEWDTNTVIRVRTTVIT